MVNASGFSNNELERVLIVENSYLSVKRAAALTNTGA
jgi:hypothetical protein